MRILISVLVVVSFLFSSCIFSSSSKKDSNGEKIVLISTEYGDIKIKLYNETPLHRDNFLKLVNEKYYDDMLFHRVINKFMIQGGDPDSRDAKQGQMLGNGGPGYTIPAEFNDKFYHKKGALAAARQGDNVNPKKESSGSQFYIVQGNVFTDEQLNQMEMMFDQKNKGIIFRDFIAKEENAVFKNKIDSISKTGDYDALNQVINENRKLQDEFAKNQVKFSEEKREVYKTLGGTPHLDGEYTIFGEVIEGLDVIDKIAALPVDGNSRPNENVKMSIKEIK